MSNIRGLKDLQNTANNARPQSQPHQYGYSGRQQNESRPLNTRDTALQIGDDPNDQNTNNNNHLAPGASGGSTVERIFPKFSYTSTIFIISCLQVLLFLITEIIAYFWHDEKSHTCVLYKFGAKYTPSIVVLHQFYRLVAPIMLHLNIGHIASNLFSQNMYGYVLEDYYGRAKFILIYLVAGIGGNALSALWQEYSLSVGASSALFGLFALNVAYIIENYEKFGNRKRLVLVIMIGIIALNFFSEPKPRREGQESSGDGGIDVASHLGGFIVGGLIAVLYSNRPENPRFKFLKIGAAIGLIIYFAVVFTKLGSLKDMATLTKLAQGFSNLCNA